MNLLDVNHLTMKILRMFFQKATVVYPSQSHRAKPELPMVTITPMSTHRVQHPPTFLIDGHLVSEYPSYQQYQIDLYTKGKEMKMANGGVIAMENTALCDMVGFCNFLGSAYFLQFSRERDITVSLTGSVMDTTHIIGASNYQYRATLEMTVHFIEQAVGYAGMLDPPFFEKEELVSVDSPSGGGNEDIALEELGFFEEALTEEENE